MIRLREREWYGTGRVVFLCVAINVIGYLCHIQYIKMKNIQNDIIEAKTNLQSSSSRENENSGYQ